MNNTISMSSDDLRLDEVPSIKDLEKIEKYNPADDQESEMFEGFVQSELLKRFVDQDDRYDATKKKINGNEFDYGEISGRLKNFSNDEISVRVFKPEGRDINDRDMGLISGASTGKTMQKSARKKYQSSLENAGYELDDPSEEELIETAERALEEIDHERFSVPVEHSTREAYGEAFNMIEEYRQDT